MIKSENDIQRREKFEVEVLDYRNRILITSQISPMAFNGLRLEYSLDGSSNYRAWKDCMEVILEDSGLKDFIDQEVPKLAAANAQELAEWKKRVARERRILLEGVRDHIVSSFHGKRHHFKC